MLSLKFYQQLLKCLEMGDVVLATVINIQGSVPREIGAKMIITQGGDIFYTIGGGAGEAKVCQYAQTVFQTGEKQRVTIDLSGATHRPTQGVCGGRMEVWLEQWTGNKMIALVKDILVLLKSGQTIKIFTPFLVSDTPSLLNETSPHPPPTVGFVEILQPPPLLFIVGAGHVGIQLAKIADMIGFEVVIQDDRPQWANTRNYPSANYIFNDPIAVVLPHFIKHSQLYFAMVTRGYTYDLEALKTILEPNINYRYLGMIGSKKRVQMVIKALESDSIVKAKLRSIYAPIGLDIGALTPEEIAVSIGAELILVQRGGTGKPLSQLS